MNDAVCPLFGELRPSSAPELHRAQALGLALQLAATSPAHRGLPLAEFTALARSAWQVGQFKTYVNPSGECLGYVVWAMLTPDVEGEYIAGAPRPLADWEFNDGTSAFVLDFAVAPGLLRRVMQELRDVVFKEHEHVTYYRTKGVQRLCKRISRTDRTTFMAAGRGTGEVAQ